MSQFDRLNEFHHDFVPPTNSLDEHYWSNFRKLFFLDDNVINFRANAASPVPKKVLDFFEKEYRSIESLPSEKNKGIEEGEKEALRVTLSREINCSIKELAIMRNTTEALNNVIMGFPFKKNDEVVASVHEYDSMMGSLYQRQIKDGIIVKTISIPYRPQSKEQIVEIFEKNILIKPGCS